MDDSCPTIEKACNTVTCGNARRLQVQRHPASLDKILELVLSDSLVGNLAKFFWDSLFSKTFAGKLQALQVLSHPLALAPYDRWVFVLNFPIPS